MRCCEIDIGRCPCIHARFQAIDAILQCILYQRGLIPAPVNQLLVSPETSPELKFVENYKKIREALKEIFRSHNRSSIRGVIVLIGNSCLLPKELYSIQVDLCGIQTSESCHPECSELSERELRKVSASLLLKMFGEEAAVSNAQASQVYVFVRASSNLHFPVDLIEEDDGFVFPSQSVILRKKITLFPITLKHHCEMLDVRDVKEEDESLTWFRVSSSLRKFST